MSVCLVYGLVLLWYSGKHAYLLWYGSQAFLARLQKKKSVLWTYFLHFYTLAKSEVYIATALSVCQSVCLSVCPINLNISQTAQSFLTKF